MPHEVRVRAPAKLSAWFGPVRASIAHMRWRRVRVQLEGGGEYDGPGSFVPPVSSEHDALLAHLGARDGAWAGSALISCLEGVRDGALIEQIAVTDAWVEDDQTFCLIYTPPWADTLAGIRRQRGDLGPVVQLMDDKGQTELDDFRMSDDPQSFGRAVLNDISQPLGAFYNRLRYDTNGVGWWGTLGRVLPRRG